MASHTFFALPYQVHPGHGRHPQHPRGRAAPLLDGGPGATLPSLPSPHTWGLDLSPSTTTCPLRPWPALPLSLLSLPSFLPPSLPSFLLLPPSLPLLLSPSLLAPFLSFPPSVPPPFLSLLSPSTFPLFSSLPLSFYPSSFLSGWFCWLGQWSVPLLLTNKAGFALALWPGGLQLGLRCGRHGSS